MMEGAETADGSPAEARLWAASDLRSGLRAEFEREITAADIEAFAALSGDRNPLHVNDAYAAATNYGRKLVHGAFQVGLASAMAGMYLPGREVLVGSFNCRFPAPLFYPSRVAVQGEITVWSAAAGAGTLRVRVTDIGSSALTAEIHVAFTLHESGTRAAKEVGEALPQSVDKPIVLVTGAGGGIGETLVRVLAATYQVAAISRSGRNADGATSTNPLWIAADLSGNWEENVERRLAGRKVYGVVHAAWPSTQQGSLLDVDPAAVASQLEFGTLTTIRLARFLRAHAERPARLVVLGTTAATLKPLVQTSAYSLGKAALEHTVRLLAPELARSEITINLVTPSFVPVGMNQAKTTRVVLTETAKVPLGRLCSAEDVARAVEFFLSPGAAFVTGQNLPLTGGQI